MHASLAGGPIDRDGRPSRELCSLERPRSTGQSIGQIDCSLYPGHGRPGRSTETPTVRFLTVGGRPTVIQAVDLPKRLVFLAYKRGAYMDCFEQDFKWVLYQFFLLFWEVFSTCLRAKYFHSKGEFIKSFQSDFLEFFTTTFNPSFLTNTWSIHCYTYPIGIFVVRGFEVIKCLDHQRLHLVLWGGGCVCSRCFGF